jgi:hypothetical protein
MGYVVWVGGMQEVHNFVVVSFRRFCLGVLLTRGIAVHSGWVYSVHSFNKLRFSTQSLFTAFESPIPLF